MKMGFREKHKEFGIIFRYADSLLISKLDDKDSNKKEILTISELWTQNIHIHGLIINRK